MKKFNANFVYFTALFFAGSILGWLWEMVAFKCTHRGFSCIEIIQNLRGVLHGPWVPIYGFGFVLLVLLGLKLKKNPVGLFAGNIAVCGLLEYVAGVAFSCQMVGLQYKVFESSWAHLHWRLAIFWIGWYGCRLLH